MELALEANRQADLALRKACAFHGSTVLTAPTRFYGMRRKGQWIASKNFPFYDRVTHFISSRRNRSPTAMMRWA